MDQTTGTTDPAAPAPSPEESQPTEPTAGEQPGFGSRGRARRRARFLRRARELAYRDLGGLVYNLHRFGQRNDSLVLAKLSTLGHIDGELRAIEGALRERRAVTVLREAGITACPRCAAIHGSEDRFCPNCGLPMQRDADLPVAGAPAGAPAGGAVSQPTATVAPAATPPSTPPAPAKQSPEAPAASPDLGRSPLPPSAPPSQPQQPPTPQPSNGEQATEIIRPQASGT